MSIPSAEMTTTLRILIVESDINKGNKRITAGLESETYHHRIHKTLAFEWAVKYGTLLVQLKF